jgi:4-aminobutyrate aminotransferase / (S)-3-amino-2-methylpropionate transaminase / 5-aminovalerate transaminase
MNKTNELKALREKAIPLAIAQTTPCIVDSAIGATILDVDGNEWIDFSGGIGVVNAGHCPPSVVEAIKQQADRFLHACFQVSMYESYIRLADKLNHITPGDFDKKTFFTNSGAEAVENAIKIARKFTGRPAVLCFENAFHGRTLLGMSLTSKIAPYKAGFGPFVPEIYRVPFPYAYRMANGNQEQANEIVIQTIERAFKNRVDPETIAAVIFEPILGEGGFIPADTAFFKALRQLTNRHGILTICDEIQTGFGRSGAWYASEVFEIDYDIILSAKSMASGLPISAITGRAEMMDRCQMGGLGGTFGGNPLSCAAALATIDLFENSDILEKARESGRIIKEAFLRFQNRFECIGDVRCVGAMCAMELVKDRSTKEPSPQKTAVLTAFCSNRHLSILSAGTFSNVIRILAPLIIPRVQLNKGLEIIGAGLEACAD